MNWSSVFLGSGIKRVLPRSNSKRAFRAVAALALGCAGAFWATSAKAQESTPKIEVLARGFYGTQAVGMLGVGLEGMYRLSPHYGLGAEFDGFYVDNLEYPEPGTLESGAHCLLFAEGDLFPGWITPYARLGLGPGRYQRYHSDPYQTQAELDFAAQLSAGLALRPGPIVGKLSASPSLFGKDFVMTYGVALGARF